jgi:hypothetical protein
LVANEADTAKEADVACEADIAKDADIACEADTANDEKDDDGTNTEAVAKEDVTPFTSTKTTLLVASNPNINFPAAEAEGKVVF